MVKAAEYARKRLGGSITSDTDRPLNEAETAEAIKSIIELALSER